MASTVAVPRPTNGCVQTAFRALNQVVTPAVKAGVGTPLPIGTGLVILETTGRVSGQPRQVPLVANRLGNTVRISTVRSGSQWVKNVEANPEVMVWIGGAKRSATATIAVGEASPGPLTVVSLRLH